MFKRIVNILLGIAAVLVMSAPHAQSPLPPTLRLPDSVRPLNYAVELTILPESESFSGSMDIEVNLLKPARALWINARLLKISKGSVVAQDRKQDLVVLPGGEDFIGLQVDDELPAGPARLHLEYTGEISRKDTAGIFALREGNDWYAYTQFEPIRARRAFPCFDEPGYKVPWQLSLVVREGHVAVSNTPVASTTAMPGGMKRVTFERTPPLPSYLIAFGVGPFEVVDAGTAGMKSTPIRIITPKGMAAQARYAASVTGKILALSEQYTDIAYPYQKLDSLAVLQTISFGAMENPGLITYRMPLLLAAPKDETPRFQRAYAQVAAHEIAHMWFGDLVTHAWWDDIWLNESFATWFSRKITDRFAPDWGVKTRDLIGRNEAMTSDSLISARRIRQPIENNGDIANAFDGITYTKGSAVLGMFEAWMGEDRFQRSVRRYLNAYAHANARANDFLGELNREVPESGVAFATFLEQPGVPVISARLACDRSGARMLLAQERYLPLGSKGSSQQTWQIPICFSFTASGKLQRACTLMKTERAELPLGPTCPSSVSAETSRYYRIHQVGDNLVRRMRPQTPTQTVAWINDAGALAQNGTVELAQVLKASESLAKSSERHVMHSLINMVHHIRPAVPANLRANEARWVRKTFGEKMNALGLAPRVGESEDDRDLRPSLLQFVTEAGDDRALGSRSMVHAKQWLTNRSGIDGTMVEAALSSAARHGDRGYLDALIAELRKTQDRRERAHLLRALGSFGDRALTNAALNLVLDADIDIRESMAILWTVSEDPQRADLAYAFMKRHFDALIARMPRDAGAYFPKLARLLCSETARSDVADFFRTRASRLTGAPRILAQTEEAIGLCAALRERQESSLARFLNIRRN